MFVIIAEKNRLKNIFQIKKVHRIHTCSVFEIFVQWIQRNQHLQDIQHENDGCGVSDQCILVKFKTFALVRAIKPKT